MTKSKLNKGSAVTVYVNPTDPNSAAEGKATLIKFTPERISIADRELWLVRFLGDSVGMEYYRYILIN